MNSIRGSVRRSSAGSARRQCPMCLGSWDIRLIGSDPRLVARSVPDANQLKLARGRLMTLRATRHLFYAFFLPLAVAVNLGLGLIVLSNLKPYDWLGWLELATGAFCCIVAGVLAATAWSRSYWGGAMGRQIAVWRQMADAIFRWLEEMQLSPESLQRLKRSLDEVVPSRGSG